jgi:sialidase-1
MFLFVNPASVKERTKLTVWMSQDDCKTWAVSKMLYEGSSAYSDLAITEDTTVLCLFEAGQYLRMVCSILPGWKARVMGER